MGSSIPKMELLPENFEFCISFYQKKTPGWWDDIGIDRHSYGYTEFIIGTIKYDKHCVIKLIFPDLAIIDY